MTQPPDAPTPADPALPASAHAKRWTLFSQEGTDRGGAVLGDRFEVGELLGAGGTAWVYACRDQALRSMAAIKILKPAALADESFEKLFLREGQVLASFDHPNIVRIYDNDRVGDSAYLVMEHLPGGTLAERMRRAVASRLFELRDASSGGLRLEHVRNPVTSAHWRTGENLLIGTPAKRTSARVLDED